MDDEPSTRLYLRELLSPHYSVEILADATSALDSIRRGPPPDLILSDVVMADIDGLALLRTLRDDPVTALLPVLLITGSDDEETRLRGFEAGADDYINKPIRAREILARVRTHLDLARLRRYEGAPSPQDAADAMRVSEERFRAIVNQATAGVAELDPSGRYTLVNQKLCAVLGYTEQELLDRSFQDLVHPADLPACQSAYERLLATGEPHTADKRLIRRDGAVIWINDCVSLVPGDGSRPPRVVMVAIDITASKHMEEALRRSDEHFRLLIDSTRDYVIFTTDPEGLIATWNEGCVRLKGYRSEEIIGQHVSIFSTPEDRAAGQSEALMADALARGRSAAEGWRVRQDGTQFWAEKLLYPMRGPDGELLGFANICRDLSERKAADDERTRLLVAEQAANAAKDRFLAALSHELRTPLTPVQMALFLLRREAQISPEGRESLEIIGRNVEAEVRLIGDLLDVSRIVHGKLELNLDTASLHDCVRLALEVATGEMTAKAQTLEVSLAASADGVRGDAGRLRQVFWNLLQNAVKFTPEHGRIDVRSHDAEGWIVVDVTDTGIGLDPAVLPRLFNPFEQGAPEITREYGGLGLGLSISHAIIQSHGGELTVASDGPGQGATFRVALPLQTAVAE